MSNGVYGEAPVEQPEQPGLSEALDAVDILRSEFFDLTARYTRLPLPGTRNKLNQTASDFASAVHMTVEAVIDGEDPHEQKAQIIATLLGDEDSKRTSYFNNLVGSEATFKPSSSSRDDVIKWSRQVLEEFDEDTECAARVIMQSYIHDFNVDFTGIIEHAHTNVSARSLRLGMVVGRYALDIAKVSAGTIAGLFLYDRLRQK